MAVASFNDCDIFSDEVIMPRSWSDGFVKDEVNAEVVDAIRTIIWTSPSLSKKLPTLKSHLLFAQAVLNYLSQNGTDYEAKENNQHVNETDRNELFYKVVSACAALSKSSVEEIKETVHSVQSFDIGLTSVKNRRRLMEDQQIVLPNLSLWPSPSCSNQNSIVTSCQNCALLAVMDGHGGIHASSYIARQLPDAVYRHLASSISSDLMYVLKQSLADVERLFCERAARLKQLRVGSTVVAALIDLESGRGCIGWLGDSRADLFKFNRRSDTFTFECVTLTKPLHRPDNEVERNRIESLGGFVSGLGESIPRVNGQLGVSRSIGDLEYKLAGLVSAEPEFTAVDFPISKEQCSTSHFEILMLASDGLWDGLSCAEIGSVIKESLTREAFKTDPDWLTCIAGRLSSMASEKSDDNITCVLIARPPVNRMSTCFNK